MNNSTVCVDVDGEGANTFLDRKGEIKNQYEVKNEQENQQNQQINMGNNQYQQQQQ